jgi:sugar lactone lactonase
MSDAPGVTAYSETVCSLGEGPAAHPALARLFWFDILGKRLLERRFDHAGTIVHDLPLMASVMAVIDGERQLIAAEDGLYVREIKTGALKLHTPLEADNPVTRSNDGRVHPCGALWIGTMGKRAEPGAGTIYWFFKGELRPLFRGITVPNAIAFAPDGSHAYFTDSRVGMIWRIATDPATGLPTGERKDFRARDGGPGGPDGAATDAEGVLWNARWGAGMLDAYAPNGERVRSIAVPATRVSCPAFVGKNADRLVVTTARRGSAEQPNADEPGAGQTFLIDLPVRGRFDPPVTLA